VIISQSLRKMLRRKNELAEELESHLRMAVADWREVSLLRRHGNRYKIYGRSLFRGCLLNPLHHRTESL
jgi:hypothetical protein